MPAFIHLQVNGSNLPGTSTHSEYGGVDLAEHSQIVSFFNETIAPADRVNASSRPTVSAISVVKALDGISPLLQQAMHSNSIVNSRILFFDNDPNSGETRHSYSIVLLQARITGIRLEMQHSSVDDRSLPLERISITPQTLRHESVVSQATFERALGAGA